MSFNNIPTYKKILFFILLALVAVLAFFITQTMLRTKVERSDAYYAAYQQSLMGGDPKVLQNFFVDDIARGVNDEHTKSAAYFVTHRYFDNGGDIYEIYDYVHAHPELAFLAEAETLDPWIFGQVKDKTLPTTHTDRGTYAYLAYLQVLEKHGYGDVALFSTAANQYAKMIFLRNYVYKMTAGTPQELRYAKGDADLAKALYFLERAEADVAKIMSRRLTERDMPARSILVGLNQYASALRYLEALGADGAPPTPSGLSSREVFTFAMDYAHHNVPELYFFTSLINASTLNIIDSTDQELKVAIYPIVDFDTKKYPEQLRRGVIAKIVGAKSETDPSIHMLSLDIYGKPNFVALAKRVPDFKAWLISNGWTEEDFDFTVGPYVSKTKTL